MANIFITYILKSNSVNKTYVGHTDNLERRLNEHNQGNSAFTKSYKPWSVIHKENFNNIEESIKREKYFKSAAGRRWMKKNLFD
jgi:putative endonuclease